MGWGEAIGAVAMGASSAAGGKGGKKGGEGGALDPEFFLDVGREAGKLADPWMENRTQYIDKLNQLMKNPEAFRRDPAYLHRVEQGQRAIESSGAARGMLGSGALGVELMRYGQGEAAQEYQAQFDRLARLSGLDVSNPAAAGAALTNSLGSLAQVAGASGQQGSGTEFGQGIGGMVGGIEQLINLWGGAGAGAGAGTALGAGGFGGIPSQGWA